MDRHGFTLIELSIVLVIIGLIIGGVLVGRDLINAAGVRATLAQIEKYNTAVNTFRTKYNALPGDITAANAAAFGLAARSGAAGQGDGNGLIEGVNTGGSNCGFCTFSGEAGMFWVDLSQAALIDGNFTTAIAYVSTMPTWVQSQGQEANYFPAAKIGEANYIYVWSGGWRGASGGSSDGVNYFGLSAMLGNGNATPISNTSLTVQQAYSIDTKIDDGLPQSGTVMALYTGGWYWAKGGGAGGAMDPGTSGPVVAGDGVATTGSAATCYDNSGVSGATEHYSIEISQGTNPNCALSFMFQ